jgi:hypothetical protein
LNFLKSQIKIFNTYFFDLVYQKNDINFEGQIFAVDIHNFDTIFLLYPEGRLVQTDTSFLTHSEWKIEPISKEYELDYYIGDPLQIANHCIYVGHYPNYQVNTKERIATYFSKHPIIKLSFENPKIVLNYYGRFPEFYQNSSYNLHPCWLTIVGNDVITSFSETDSIYKNNNPVASIRSNYFTKNKEEDVKRVNRMDMVYIMKLATENCRYGPLLYNHYLKQYYRMFHFSTKYDNNDGTVNSPKDAKKSIIVTDENFNILKEVVLPPEYFIYDSYITPEGLMIKKEDKNDKKNTYFDFFSL